MKNKKDGRPSLSRKGSRRYLDSLAFNDDELSNKQICGQMDNDPV